MTLELSIIQQTLALAFEQAETEGASQIHLLKIRISKEADLNIRPLQSAFEMFTRGTIAEGAHLEIETVSVIYHCALCDWDFYSINEEDKCPLCGKVSQQVVSGKEIELVSLEVS